MPKYTKAQLNDMSHGQLVDLGVENFEDPNGDLRSELLTTIKKTIVLDLLAANASYEEEEHTPSASMEQSPLVANPKDLGTFPRV